MNKEIQIRVVPTNKTSMCIWGHTVFVDNGFLEISTDLCLQSAIRHEEGHLKNRPVMFAISCVSLGIFALLLFALPFTHSLSYLLVMAAVFYLWLCHLSRLGELHADFFALKNSSVTGLYEMLAAEGSRLDNPLAKIFCFLRFHPSTRRRLKNLGLSYQTARKK